MLYMITFGGIVILSVYTAIVGIIVSYNSQTVELLHDSLMIA